MGRSVGAPSVFTGARLVHKLSNSVLTVVRRGNAVDHKVERDGLSAEYRVAYSVGAGIVGYSYIVRVGRYLFQSPLSYYTQVGSWDLTPGYETDPHLDFTHQISEGCLFCHTGSVNPIPGAANQFADPPFTPISCERCHGPSAAHVQAPSGANIINPARLPPRERDSVCEQCHMEGDIRILGPGRDWWDFHAGQPTESVWATYLDNSSQGSLRAVSQSELLARSQCARQSGGKLWCGSCHDPHASPQNRAGAMQRVCMSCHSALFDAGGHAPASECVSCHMPRLRPGNVPHAAVTDHSIPRRPRNAPGGFAPDLTPWHPPESAEARRDLGLAYFERATKTRSAEDARMAYEILSKLRPEQRKDPPVEADLASVLLQTGESRLAIELFSAAATQAPANARYAYVLGAALERTGNPEEAIRDLRRSIEIDPSQPDPYLELAGIYQKLGRKAESREVLRKYLDFMPQNLQFRLMK
ncbi:MAG TPA: tetratricopeptide repeat protein [Bryobacteraceae bacterium]|nr:tetratricopeptide repeat protein [Bryobacteraceae bacterium]